MSPWIVSAALTAIVAAYLAIITHQFFQYIDRAIYLAVDDGVANTSYALAYHGQYGFPASPVLLGMSRNHGLFNYGPWYFYLGAWLIWLFGYSLTLLRAIHLAVLTAAVVAARLWLSRGRPSTPEWGLFALGVLWVFDPGQWPMVRPDIMVSAFAIAFVVAAGSAIQRQSWRWWAVAGCCAGCGAFTHLIAWSMVPAAAFVWVLDAIRTRRATPPHESRRLTRHSLIALIVGGAVAAAMFFASFSFRVVDQWQFLHGYRELTHSLNAGEDAFAGVALRHFNAAFGWFPVAVQRVFVIALAAAWVLVIRATLRRSEKSAPVLALVAPPLVTWTAYLVTLGFYPNFHSGYTILSQVLALWTVAALAKVLLQNVPSRGLWSAANVAIGIVLCAAGLWMIRDKLRTPNYRLLHAQSWIGSRQYVDEVLGVIPRGATAWGSVTFGIETPDRIQLVQYFDAVMYAPAVPADVRASLSPEFLIWSYPENRGVPSDALMGQPTWPQSMASLFPGNQYSLQGLVAAAPYGTTRIYARRLAGTTGDTRPIVAAFDSERQQWRRLLGLRLDVAFKPAESRLIVETTRTAEPRRVEAAETYEAGVAPGWYLLHVGLQGGNDPIAARMVMATGSLSVSMNATELAPQGDLAAFGVGDKAVDLLLKHGGGRLYVGLFDSTRQVNITSIEVVPIERVTATRARESAMVRALPAGQWHVYTDHGATTANGAVTVRGNASQYGYQAISDPIPIPPGARALLRVDVRAERGAVCLGVLDKTTRQWLVAAEALNAEYEFVANESGGAFVVVANCNGNPTGNTASAFTIRSATIEVDSNASYNDRFVNAAIAAGAIKP
jgi:hypothetical protein